MDIKYIISSEYNYAGYVCDDSGPAIADDYGWPAEKVRQGSFSKDTIQVIDPLMNKEEQATILQQIDRASCHFFLRVTDPYWTSADFGMTSFILEAIKRKNVFLMLTYTPNEQSAYYLSKSTNKNFVIAPYVYRKEKEVPISKIKTPKILLSGNLRHETYPLRRKFFIASRIHPWLRMKTHILRHPGYSTSIKAHTIVRDKYIKFISEFQYCFVCPARTRSEFLKYREISYAGSVPVGQMPMSLIDCPEDAFIRYIGGARSIYRTITNLENPSEMAHKFREFMRKKRDRKTMIACVERQISDVLA